MTSAPPTWGTTALSPQPTSTGPVPLGPRCLGAWAALSGVGGSLWARSSSGVPRGQREETAWLVRAFKTPPGAHPGGRCCLLGQGSRTPEGGVPAGPAPPEAPGQGLSPQEELQPRAALPAPGTGPRSPHCAARLPWGRGPRPQRAVCFCCWPEGNRLAGHSSPRAAGAGQRGNVMPGPVPIPLSSRGAW